MNNDKDNLKFKKSMKNSKNTFKPQNQDDMAKLKIINKFNVTPEEANEILYKIKKRKLNKNKNSKNKSVHKFDSPPFDYNTIPKRSVDEKEISFKNGSNNKNMEIINKKSNKFPKNKVNNKNQSIINNSKLKGNEDREKLNENNSSIIDNKKTKIFSQNKKINNTNTPENNLQQQTPIKKNVDSLLEEIIPDYNQQISIKLEHVDLTFEVENEKIDTLKEAFISSLKRSNVKKMKIHALKDISFQIYKGEKVGIIGYNGAGKSTLLNVITGIYHPDKGNVITQGNISPLLSLGAGFDYNFSGRKNIFLNGAVLGYDKQYLESKIDEIIEFSELEDFIDIPIKNYSSGMLAKLGFSIATSVNPDILIIDEILGVGDVNFMKKSADKIKSLMDGGTTVLLVSHSIPQIRELCDKAIWIDNGCVRDIGEVNKICDKYLKDAEKASNKQLANIKLTK